MNILLFIYQILALLTSAVLMLFNNSCSEGIFPECFTTAKIIQIFKFVDFISAVNYKPISMLLFSSKIFENLMCSRLDSYLKSDNILCIQINLASTKIQMQQIQLLLNFLIDYVCSSLDKKQSTIDVYLLDFSKAFDTVNHDKLMSKLLHNGSRGVMQSWFNSYFSNIIF